MKDILKFIHQFRKKYIFISFYNKLYRTFLSLTLLSSVLFLVEKIFWQDTDTRKLLLILWVYIFFILTIYLLSYLIISYFSLFGNSSNEKYALKIGNYYPFIKDRLLNTIQLNKINPSLDLVKLETKKINLKLSNLDINKFFKTKLNKFQIIFQAIVIIMALIYINTFYSKEINRYLNFNTVYNPPTPFNFELINIQSKNGDYISNKNFYALDSINISYQINQNLDFKNKQTSIPDSIFLCFKNNIKIDRFKITNKNDSLNTFSLLTSHLNTNSIVWAEYINNNYFSSWDTIQSNKDSIKIRTRPKITNFELEFIPPEYSNIKPYSKTQSSATHFEILNGTTVKIKINSDKILQKAWMKLHDSQINLSTINNVATGSFEFNQDTTLRIYLMDISNDYNLNPVQYNFHLLNDNLPNIIVSKPKNEFILDESYKIPYNINVYDDLGITKIGIEFQIIESENYTRLDTFLLKDYNQNFPTSVNVYNDWNIQDLPLSMGDELHFYFFAVDNNTNKNSYFKSKKYIGRFPTLEDLFTEIEEYENETISIVDDMKESLEDILDTVEETELDLLKNSDLEWEEEQKIEESFEKVDELYEEINQIQENIEKILEQAENNNLFNEDLLEKFNQFQSMLQNIMSDDLLLAMEKMQNAMAELTPEEMLGALENFEQNIENFEQELDRFIEMFELAEAEKKLNELAENLENMLNKQTDLLDKINSDPTKKNTLTALSENQESRFEKFSNLLDETASALQEISPKSSEKLEKLEEQNNKAGTNEKLKETKTNIENDEINKAKNNIDSAKTDLEAIQSQIQEIQEEFKSEQIQELKIEYLIIIDNLLTTTYQQEKLINSALGLRGNNPMIQNINSQQNNLDYEVDQIMDQLLSLANKTLFIRPDISKSFGSIKTQLNKIISNFAQKKVSQGRTAQLASLNNMNNTILLLLESLNELKNSETVSGIEQFLEAMEEMSQKQQGINQGTSQMNMFGPSQKQSVLEQLLNQQQQLKQQLEDLLGENPGENNSGMQKALEDMEEVIKDFQNNNINSETIERQEEILSKMLDNQKSLKQKEYSEKRKSKRGDQSNYIDSNPQEIPSDYGNKDLMIINAMEEAMDEGFSKEYNMRLRNYFLNLNKNNSNEK